MHIIRGQSVSKGKASGKFHFIENNSYVVEKKHCKKTEHELIKYQRARGDTMNQLQTLYEKALNKVGENDAKIFAIQQMILYEEDFTNSIRTMIINENVIAQYAVYKIALDYMIMLEATNDAYMMARTADVHDVAQRIIMNINRKKLRFFKPPSERNIIVYKNYFTPSEIIELDTKNIHAAITFKDSFYSHSAILARTMNLPRITGISSEDILQYDGKAVIVDADCGEISFKLK